MSHSHGAIGGNPQVMEPSAEAVVTGVQRRISRLGWVAGTIGSIVVFISIGFLIPIFLGPEDKWDLTLMNGPLVAAYLVVAGLIVSRSGRLHFERTVGWIVEGRAPDEREHRQDRKSTRLNSSHANIS